MARVAVNAVVDVAVHIRVMEVRRIVAAMAARACEHRVIRGVCVARSADPVSIAVVDREEGMVTAW